MNGGADLGGMMGFGPVVQEEDEPNSHDHALSFPPISPMCILSFSRGA